MSDESSRRLEKLENAYEELEKHIAQLNTTIALLNQSLEGLIDKEQKRQQLRDRSLLFVIGGLISAVMAWIIRGGLGS